MEHEHEIGKKIDHFALFRAALILLLKLQQAALAFHVQFAQK